MLTRMITAIGETDCETIGPGVLAQPVNAFSSLSYAVFGIAVYLSIARRPADDRRNRLLFGFLMVATGLGSVAFHGPQGSPSQFFHDVTFLSTIIAIGVLNLAGMVGRVHRNRIAIGTTVLAGMSAVLLIWPASTNVIAALAVAWLIGTDFAVRRSTPVLRGWWFTAIGAMILALVAFGLGRTGSPLCDSDSLLQGHALWHLMSAAALWSYFESTTPIRTGGHPE